MINVHSCAFEVTLLSFLLLAASSQAGPKIHCENPVWGFGERLNGGTLVHEFLVENRGDEPLVFGPFKNCCGLTVEFPTRTLGPGSNAVCKATFDVSRRSGEQNKAIYIASNDPKQPYLILKMQGFLKQTLDIQPRYVRFSPADGKAAKSVRMISSEAPFSIRDVTCSMEGVQVVTNQISETEWELDVTLAPNVPGGKVSGSIAVRTDHPQHPTVNISLYGKVPPAVNVFPSEVLVKAGGKFASRVVAVRSEESFKILSADLKKCEGPIEMKKLGKTGWSFGLTLNPSSIQSDAKLLVTTDHPLMPILTIPVRRVE